MHIKVLLPKCEDKMIYHLNICSVLNVGEIVLVIQELKELIPL